MGRVIYLDLGMSGTGRHKSDPIKSSCRGQGPEGRETVRVGWIQVLTRIITSIWSLLPSAFTRSFVGPLSLLAGRDYSLPKMAGKLCNMATRIMGGSSLVGRSLSSSSLHFRSGMGLPVGKHIVPDKPLPVNDELIWDNGTPFPEPCIDRIAPTVGKYEALAWMCGGLGFFAGLALLAVWNDKASKIPFTPKVYPFDNLRVELGGEP